MNTNAIHVSMNGGKEKFIHDEILMSVIQGTLSRNPTYDKHVKDGQKAEFRKELKKKLDEFGKKYDRCDVNEIAHVENIESLADTMSSEYGSMLICNRFRIGSAQKALNLYLKYLWCLGKIDMPPHCPIDRIILEELKCDIKWTKLDCIKEYRHIIEKAREEAGSRPLARWELDEFNSKR